MSKSILHWAAEAELVSSRILQNITSTSPVAIHGTLVILIVSHIMFQIALTVLSLNLRTQCCYYYIQSLLGFEKAVVELGL